MKRTVFIEDESLQLMQYTRDDDIDFYNCGIDIAAQKGFNTKTSFEPYGKNAAPDTSRFPFNQEISRFPFWSVIYDKANQRTVGVVRLSPPPYDDCDLAIWIYAPFRNMGYGTRAFRLGVIHCLYDMKLEKVWAGCYENNAASLKMLGKIGFLRDENGDSHETDAFTGEPITQLSFVITRREMLPRNGL